KAAKDALGDKAIAITLCSPSIPKREILEASQLAEELGVTHLLVKGHELENPDYVKNAPDRCYVCKSLIFESIISAAKNLGVTTIAEGSNVDDMSDYRPGRQALEELKIKSPLLEAGFTKEDIRTVSKWLQLPTWNKQSYACLASRFPYGSPITEEKLAMVDKAEQYLLDEGFHQVRVRVHDKLARIEVSPDEMDNLYQLSKNPSFGELFHEIGFDYVALDLEGYRTGSLNAGLNN
ncbi:MAG: ATP-dependent sacrificial sulfur transferase LarE, partial [Anaerotardibacter sp.]